MYECIIDCKNIIIVKKQIAFSLEKLKCISYNQPTIVFLFSFYPLIAKERHYASTFIGE